MGRSRVASTGIEIVLASRFIRFIANWPAADKSGGRVDDSGAACCPKDCVHCDGARAKRQSGMLCINLRGVEKSLHSHLFCGAAKPAERIPASLAMTDLCMFFAARFLRVIFNMCGMMRFSMSARRYPEEIMKRDAKKSLVARGYLAAILSLLVGHFAGPLVPAAHAQAAPTAIAP